MKKIKVSIIVPIYNVEKYLNRCLDSIVNQTYTNIEIILVDDGSNDLSGNICDEYYKKDVRIKVIHQKNSGSSIARNNGMNIASGEYLLFVDSDDFISKEMIEDMVNKTKQGLIDLVICDYYNYYDETNKAHIKIIPFHTNSFMSSPIISMPTATCKLMKKDLLSGIQFPSKLLFEDNAIMPYVVSLSKEYSYIEKPYYYYYQREGSTLNKKDYYPKWADIFKALEMLISLFKSNNTYNKYKEEIEYIYIRYLLHASNIKSYRYEIGKEQCAKISKIIKEQFPNWKKNKYYKKESIKYKIVCNLFYLNKLNLVKAVLRK